MPSTPASSPDCVTSTGSPDDGAITADHVDAVTRASKQLDGAERAELIRRADAFVDVARAGTVDEFSRRLDLERKRLQDDDGMDRLARQRRNVRARSWVDAEGMWNLSVTFDPVTGVRVAARIDAMVQAMFGETVPDECPTDPIEKQRYLAAHATARLLLDEALHDHTADDDGGQDHPTDGSADGPGSPGPARPPRPPRARPAKPEFVAVIDAEAPGHGPVAEFFIPVEIPARVLATLAGNADTQSPSCATVWCCTHPANSTWDAPPASPTAPNAAASAASTNVARSPAAASPTTAAHSTTSSGGATTAAARCATATVSRRGAMSAGHRSSLGRCRSREPPARRVAPRRRRRRGRQRCRCSRCHRGPTRSHSWRRSERPPRL
jgi:hypothetical protein